MQVIKQADPAHGGKQLGNGKATIGGSGCALVSMAIAEQLLSGRRADVLRLNDEGRRVGAFAPGASGANLELLAHAAGLSAPLSKRLFLRFGDTARARNLIVDTLVAGGVCILHVDHDRDRVGGDEEPDHFVLATGFDDVDLHYADPAPGEVGRLQLRTLVGAAVWREPGARGDDDPGDIRIYRVRSVLPVFLA